MAHILEFPRRMPTEDDRTVEKWVKPAPGRWLCEPKRAREMTSEGVVEKARAAVAWCERATRLTAEGGGKPHRR